MCQKLWKGQFQMNTHVYKQGSIHKIWVNLKEYTVDSHKAQLVKPDPMNVYTLVSRMQHSLAAH